MGERERRGTFHVIQTQHTHTQKKRQHTSTTKKKGGGESRPCLQKERITTVTHSLSRTRAKLERSKPCDTHEVQQWAL